MPKLRLPIDAIVVDPAILPRVVEDDAIVAEYAEDMRINGLDGWPEPVVFFDGETNWLADGARRRAAAKRIGQTQIVVDLHRGDRQEAIWYAAGSNRQHGVRLNNKEKRQAIDNVLAVSPSSSDNSIATQVGVSPMVVAARRRHIGNISPGGAEEIRVDRRGRRVNVAPLRAPRNRPGRPSDARKAAQAAKKIRDYRRKTVPAWCRAVFEDLPDITNWMAGLRETVIRPVERFVELPTGAGSLIDPRVVAGLIDDVRNAVRERMPWCVCPVCIDEAEAANGCLCCHGRGWLTEDEFRQWDLAQ